MAATAYTAADFASSDIRIDAEFSGRAIVRRIFGPKTVCAWCLSESGDTPKPGQSYGICARHYREMTAEIEATRKARAA